MLCQGLLDPEILSVLDQEFPKGMFNTTNAKAIACTKWDLAKNSSIKTEQKAAQQPWDPLDRSELIDMVVDWKSDVDPTPKQIEIYRGQVRDYLKACGADAGLIVFLTSGRVERIEPQKK